MSKYFIPEHVHVHATADAAIFLDVRADHYHGLTREQSHALSTVVHGWPRLADLDATGHQRSVAELVADLTRQELLTLDGTNGHDASSVKVPLVEKRLYEWDIAASPTIRLQDVMYMSAAYACAAARLRFGSLARSVQHVRQRKGSVTGLQPIDLDRARSLTRIYRALRPLFYSVRNQCLLDSLVLIEFLAYHEIFPTWVIGVRPMPFAAHSWVQMNEYVLNSPVGVVHTYAPILAA